MVTYFNVLLMNFTTGLEYEYQVRAESEDEACALAQISAKPGYEALYTIR